MDLGPKALPPATSADPKARGVRGPRGGALRGDDLLRARGGPAGDLTW